MTAVHGPLERMVDRAIEQAKGSSSGPPVDGVAVSMPGRTGPDGRPDAARVSYGFAPEADVPQGCRPLRPTGFTLVATGVGRPVAIRARQAPVHNAPAAAVGRPRIPPPAIVRAPPPAGRPLAAAGVRLESPHRRQLRLARLDGCGPRRSSGCPAADRRARRDARARKEAGRRPSRVGGGRRPGDRLASAPGRRNCRRGAAIEQVRKRSEGRARRDPRAPRGIRPVLTGRPRAGPAGQIVPCPALPNGGRPMSVGSSRRCSVVRGRRDPHAAYIRFLRHRDLKRIGALARGHRAKPAPDDGRSTTRLRRPYLLLRGPTRVVAPPAALPSAGSARSTAT